jgi:ligand-binding sensor domain-containing protein
METSQKSTPVLISSISPKFLSRVALALAIMVTGALPVVALDPNKAIDQYGHKVFLRDNGLPTNAINVSLQTRDGFLWLGTSAGLSRFDGLHFEQVSTNPADANDHETV